MLTIGVKNKDLHQTRRHLHCSCIRPSCRWLNLPPTPIYCAMVSPPVHGGRPPLQTPRSIVDLSEFWSSSSIKQHNKKDRETVSCAYSSGLILPKETRRFGRDCWLLGALLDVYIRRWERSWRTLRKARTRGKSEMCWV